MIFVILAGSTRSSALFAASVSPLWKSIMMWLLASTLGGEGIGAGAIAGMAAETPCAIVERKTRSRSFKLRIGINTTADGTKNLKMARYALDPRAVIMFEIIDNRVSSERLARFKRLTRDASAMTLCA